MKINITKNGQTISLESDSAGVPDVTEGAGPDLIQLQEDAKKNPSDPNAEFDSNVPSTQSETEHDDKPEEAEKANEAMFLGRLFAKATPKEKVALAAVLAREAAEPDAANPAAGAEDDEPETPAPEATPAAEPEATPAPEENPAEVTQTPDATVVEVDGVKIEISNDTDDAGDDSAAPAPAPEAEPETSTEEEPAADPNQSIESLFANLDLQDL